MDAPKYPLPFGHVFGPLHNSLSHHNGNNFQDAMALKQWQQRLRGQWRQSYLQVTGLYDGPTQRAVLRVQDVASLPRTGVLGPREWSAAWTHELPTKPKLPPEKERRKMSWPGHRKEWKQRRAYWDQYSLWGVDPSKTPDAPEWFPGRPFGIHERGPWVEQVQRMLGFHTSGKFTVKLMQRIRGLQTAHELPVTGFVDVGTAKLLERLYGED